MAAVWAVALLVVCSGVRSYGQEVQATITQVRLATTTTASDESTATAAPAITTTTAGPGDSRSAVLSGNHLTTEGVPLVLVDLARNDREKLSSVSATPPAADPVVVPEGFDINEFSEDEAPAPSGDPVVPEGFDTNEFAEDVTPGSEGEGHVVTGFPSIPETDDKSYGAGYGVVAPQTVDDPPAGESFATSEDAAPGPAAVEEGHVVTGFPTIPGGGDHTQGAGYGVVAPQTADDNPGTSESFAASEGDKFTAASEDTPAGGEGHVVTGFPAIPETTDNTYAAGYGVVAPQTADDTPGTSESFTSYAGDEFSVASEEAPAGEHGHVVTGFPAIPETADNTYGANYGDGDSFGVQSSEDGVDADPAQSFAAAAGEDEGGFEVTGFPTEIGGERSSVGAYGDAASESFADFDGGQFSVQSSGGQQVEGFPELGSFSDDSSRGNAFGGVRPYGPFYGRP